MVVDGKNTSIWEDPWVIHRKDLYPKLIGSTLWFQKVADILLENKEWDLQKLALLFDQETIVNIRKVGKPTGRGKDYWVWTREAKGQFSSKSAYLIQVLDRAYQCDVAPSLWNRLWNSKILECHKIMWWSILSNVFPICKILGQRMTVEDTSCPICGGNEKTIEYLFLNCNLVFHLWRSSPWGLIPISDSSARIWDCVKFLWNLNSRGVNVNEIFLYASIIIDTIWRTQNDKLSTVFLYDPLIGEASVCLLAIETSVALGYNFVIVESDSEIIINSIRRLSP
uniref:Reverse transcriptase zinc-binding domain-containing protein n=1 Tax=Cannabis sativa TaxID=3483 RepID=A0A803NM66_CANSA